MTLKHDYKQNHKYVWITMYISLALRWYMYETKVDSEEWKLKHKVVNLESYEETYNFQNTYYS